MDRVRLRPWTHANAARDPCFIVAREMRNSQLVELLLLAVFTSVIYQFGNFMGYEELFHLTDFNRMFQTV